LFAWAVLVLALALAFLSFFKAVAQEWFQNEIFSYGILIPAVSGYLIWQRRAILAQREVRPSHWGLGLAIIGCGLRVMGELGGIQLVSGAALILVLIGGVVYLRGSVHARVVAWPLAFLILMVPWPSYTLGAVSWRLQSAASTISAITLEQLGIPVFQDGNLLYLPQYTLAVKEACSGTRSLFALVALAAMLGMTAERRWGPRLLLLALAPVIALLSNVVRIVGTGIAANWFGEVVARQSLHAAWGVVVFGLGVAGLIGAQRVLRCLGSRYASAS